MDILARKVHDLLVLGSLIQGGSWGGDECRAFMDHSTHIIEACGWMILLGISYFLLNINDGMNRLKTKSTQYYKANERSLLDTIISNTLATIHFIMYGMLIYYKTNISSLINLTQPCHVILLLQGIALYSKGPLGVSISVFILPSLVGCFLALLFPDTSGLHQFLEEQSYWYQHYLILIVPLYLLCRDNFLASNLASVKTVMIGLWILSLLHFGFYEFIDLSLNVNVEFMLCPTPAMAGAFQYFPEWLLWPSYRSFMAISVMIIAYPLSYVYIFSSRLLKVMFSKQIKSD